jgi:hypothetical protein
VRNASTMGGSTAMADHLEELLKDTPMGRIKLLAAWDSLSTETQIRLLAVMREKGRTRVGDRPIWLKALSSPNEYVRYLSAREVRYPRDDEIENKVMSDSSPLVRYSQASGWWLDKLSNEDFDRCPREQKLAIVSNDDPPSPAKLARWVGHAAELKTIREDEIYDVVCEYLCNPEALRRLKETSYDFFGDEAREEGFKALWELLPKVPNSVAHCLVVRLPWKGVLSAEPPSEVLTWLETSPYLESLLWREDAPLLELRRKVFFSTDPKDDNVKPAAVSHNFYLGPEELHDLFKQNSKLLSTLAVFSRSLSPVMLLALRDSVWKQGGGVRWDDLRSCEDNFESALAKLKSGHLQSPYGRDREIRFIRVYRLAKTVMAWNGTEPSLDAIPEPLKFLGDKVMKGDTWGTFLAFARETANRRFDQVLPRLEDLNLEEESATGEKQTAIEATTSAAKSAQGSSLLGNTTVVLGIVAALLAFLFAVGGVLDNEYRNFRSGVIAMAISAGAIVFAGAWIRREAAMRNRSPFSDR